MGGPAQPPESRLHCPNPADNCGLSAESQAVQSLAREQLDLLPQLLEPVNGDGTVNAVRQPVFTAWTKAILGPVGLFSTSGYSLV